MAEFQIYNQRLASPPDFYQQKICKTDSLAANKNLRTRPYMIWHRSKKSNAFWHPILMKA
jgi:hypothetical protein